MSLGHPAGQTGVYRPVSLGSRVSYYGETDRKGHSGAFQKFDVIFSQVPFLLPNLLAGDKGTVYQNTIFVEPEKKFP